MRTSIAREARLVAVVLARIDALAREMVALRQRVEQLEARFAPGDAADVAVLVAIIAARVPQPFTSRALLTVARTDPALATALEAADVTNTLEMGKLLSRLRVRSIEGFVVDVADVVRAGTRWRILVRR